MNSDSDDTAITVGSGNIFADLGLAEPDLAMKKFNVASKIRETIRQRDWTQTEAAEFMGISPTCPRSFEADWAISHSTDSSSL